MTLHIISGSPREAEQYAEKRGISDYAFVSTGDQMRALPDGSRVVLTGNFFKNPISNNLRQFKANYIQEDIEPVSAETVRDIKREDAKKRLQAAVTQEPTPAWDDVLSEGRTPFVLQLRVTEIVHVCFLEATNEMRFSYEDALRLSELERKLISRLVEGLGG